MHTDLIRLSKADSLLLAKATLYKWHHLGKYPRLFVKLGGAVFVDLKVLDEIVEEGRGR
jgi:hypothetical protein